MKVKKIKRIQDFHKYLKDTGWILIRKKKHMIFKRNKTIMVTSSTPSDNHAVNQMYRLLKKKEKEIDNSQI